MILPPELCYMVIDALPIESEDGWKAICKCLLVSGLFFHCSRARLFSFLDIRPRKVDKMAGLRSLLEYNDGLSDTNGYSPLKDCVRSLQVSVWDGVLDLHITDKTPTIDDTVSILRILAKSTKIQELHVRSAMFLKRQGVAPYYRAIKKICQSSSLVKLNISSALRFEEVFNIWELRELELKRTSINEDPEGAATAHNGIIPRLEVFSYMLGGRIPPRWLNKPSPFSNLRKLELIVTHDPFDRLFYDYVLPLNKLFAITAATLTTLHICTHPFDPADQNPLPKFKELRALQVLCYTLSLMFGSPQYLFNQIEQISESLKMEEIPSSLRRIVIRLYFPWVHAIGIDFIPQHTWIGLGEALMDNQFTTKDDLKITIEVFSKGQPPAANANGANVEVQQPFEKFPEIWRARFPSIEIISCPNSSDPFDF